MLKSLTLISLIVLFDMENSTKIQSFRIESNDLKQRI